MPLAVFVHSLTSEFGFYSSAESSIFTLPSIKLSEERQYKSWSLPLAVILIVPMCLMSAMTGVLIRAQDNNIFTQIGFIVLVGLVSKNAILIVEFDKQQM